MPTDLDTGGSLFFLRRLLLSVRDGVQLWAPVLAFVR